MFELDVGRERQAIFPELKESQKQSEFSAELTYFVPSGKTSGWSSFNSTSCFLISF